MVEPIVAAVNRLSFCNLADIGQIANEVAKT